MRVSCPSCRRPVKLKADTPLSHTRCPSCGETFAVPTDDTVDFPDPLPAASRDHPDRLGRLKLVRHLGRTSGSVFKAHDEQLERHVVVKFSAGDLRGTARQRLLNEASILARLRHRNIIGLLDVGEQGGQTFLVTEHIDDETLVEWLRDRPLHYRDAARLCLKLASALEHMHDQGIIHRDLKPANIVMDKWGEPYLVDFGLAIWADDSKRPEEGVVGSLAYMSPEQAAGNPDVDARTDIFSLGVVLFELLTGQRPFRANSLRGTIARELQLRPREINARIPVDLECICLKCLAVSPADRYASAQDLIHDLEEFLSGRTVSARIPSVIVRGWRWFCRQLNVFVLVLLAFSASTLLPMTGLAERIAVAAGLLAILLGGWYGLSYLRRDSRASGATLEPESDIEEQIHRLSVRNQQLQREVARREHMLLTTQAEHQLYRELVESLPLCVFTKDKEGRFIFANDHFCQTFNLSLDQIENRTSAELFSSRLAAIHKTEEAMVIASGTVMESVEEHIQGSETKTFEVFKSPVRNFDGEVVGVQGLMWDVSERARATDALRDAKEAAEAASRTMTEFLANISHEIRTPLTAIIGVTELQLEKDLDDDSREQLTTVHESGNALLRILNDILDYSKIESDRLLLDDRPFDLAYLLDNVTKTVSVGQRAANLTIGWQFDGEVPTRVKGDSDRLRQILLNLMGNAVKFTERGEVTTTVLARYDAGGRPEFHFQVTDSGEGIPADKLQAIFEKFTQVDSSSSRRHGGTGLGLPIAAGLVRLMGGRIWVESTPGVGSTFHFTVRLQPTDGPIETPREDWSQHPRAAKPLKILLTDDVHSNRLLVHHRLRSMGHRVDVVCSGQEAIDRLAADTYDVVLMDVQMPGMDGLDCTRRIRQREALQNGRIPIIAMTAHAMKGDRAKCFAAGMDAYVSKPIEWDELIVAIHRVTKASSEKLPLVDADELLRRVGGDREFLGTLLTSFLEACPRLLSEVGDACRTGDTQALQRSCHKLRGAISNLLGHLPIVAVERLEQMGRQQSMEGASDLLRMLEADVERLLNELAKLQEQCTKCES